MSGEYTYFPALVIDAYTGTRAQSATGYFYDAIGGSPQQIFDYNLVELTSLTTSAEGICPGWKANLPYGFLSFGTIMLPVVSLEAIGAAGSAQTYATAAAASAAEAAASAATVADAVQGAIDTFAIPIQFGAALATVGVTGSNRAYAARTLTGARMRVASAPVGSPLTVQVQTWAGVSWVTAATLTLAAGSTAEQVATFTAEQAVGDLLRLNITSAGSTTPAGGVVVDVTWN